MGIQKGAEVASYPDPFDDSKSGPYQRYKYHHDRISRPNCASDFQAVYLCWTETATGAPRRVIVIARHVVISLGSQTLGLLVAFTVWFFMISSQGSTNMH